VRAAHKAEPRDRTPERRHRARDARLHLRLGPAPVPRPGARHARGHTFGHEFTGVVEEVGSSVRNLKKGDRVLVPFNIFCGTCFFCQKELYSNCHNVNPEATAVGGIYGYSHTTGGYDGGQAEYVRVPMADVGPTVIPPTWTTTTRCC
jgi:threonine dehydrogenase-like Zn-dependent dehydrogenase